MTKDDGRSKPKLLIWNHALEPNSKAAKSLSQQFNLQFMSNEDAVHLNIKDDNAVALVPLHEMIGHRTPEQRIHEQHAAQALHYIGQAVCIYSYDGQPIWSNNLYKQLPEQLRLEVRTQCAQAGRDFSSTGQSSALMENRKFKIEPDDDSCYEIICSPIVEPDNEQNTSDTFIAIFLDNSRENQLQKKIDAIDAAGSEIVRIESDTVASLNTAQRLALLEDHIIEYTRDLLHFDHFNIYLLEESTNRLLPVMMVGMPAEVAEYELYASPEGSGISGSVAATAQSFICGDVSKDPRYLPGLKGAVSSLSVPLRLHDKVVGVFNIESQKTNAFSEDDRQFAEIFGRYVALALNILDLLVVERTTTSGTVAVNVIGEVDQPLNDMTAVTQKLRDRFITDPQAVQDFDRIITLIDNVRSRVRSVAQGPKNILGIQNEMERRETDPRFVGKRILVADDEANIRETIASVITKRGAQVLLAENGSQAVELIHNAQSQNKPFDLILSDISMPDHNGYEVFAAARKHHEGVPVILMTGFGYDPHHSIVRASQEGLQCVLFKPFQIDHLIEEISKALATNQNK